MTGATPDTAGGEGRDAGAPLVLSIVMPVRNDAPSVNVMIRILTAMIDVPHELIVVWDDPADTTAPVVAGLQPRFPTLRGVLNTDGRGVFNAVRAGVRSARGTYVLIYAADEIGPVLAVDRMLALMRQGCDLVSATRYAAGGRRLGGSRLRHALSRTANRLFCLFSSTALSDCTTGIKMFRRDVFDRIGVTGQGGGWSFAFEMAVKAQVIGLRIGEVPIVSIDRLFGGESTFRPVPWVIAYGREFLWGVGQLPRWRRPRPRLVVPAEEGHA